MRNAWASRKVERHRLARAGRAGDQEVADVALMEVEMVRRLRGRFEDRDRQTPMDPHRPPRRKIVHRGETGKVCARQHGGARDVAVVAGKLRPERGLHIEVLAQPVDVHIGEAGTELGDGLVEATEIARQAQQAEMVVAEDRFLVDEAVQREVDIGLDRAAGFVRRANLPLQTRNPLLGDRLVGNREGLGEDELVVHLQQPVEHAGPRERRIFLDREHRAEAIVGLGRPLRLQGPLREVQPRGSDIASDSHARQAHRPRQAAGQDRVDEFAGFRIGLAIAMGDSERAGAVLLQLAHDIADDLLELVDALVDPLLEDVAARRPVEQARNSFGRAQRAAHAGAHDREIELVGEHALGAQLGHVALVEQVAERIGERAAERRLDFLADDGRPQRVAARAERADHGVLDARAHVELGLVLGLEEQSVELDDGQDRAALQADHGVRDMAHIGDVGGHRPLTATLPSKSQLFNDDVQHVTAHTSWCARTAGSACAACGGRRPARDRGCGYPDCRRRTGRDR